MWAEHYERLLNIEFEWDPEHMSNKLPLEVLPIPITINVVKKGHLKDEVGQSRRSIRYSGREDEGSR